METLEASSLRKTHNPPGAGPKIESNLRKEFLMIIICGFHFSISLTDLLSPWLPAGNPGSNDGIRCTASDMMDEQPCSGSALKNPIRIFDHQPDRAERDTD